MADHIDAAAAFPLMVCLWAHWAMYCNRLRGVTLLNQKPLNINHDQGVMMTIKEPLAEWQRRYPVAPDTTSRTALSFCLTSVYSCSCLCEGICVCGIRVSI